jgi:hypothetical protein
VGFIEKNSKIHPNVMGIPNKNMVNFVPTLLLMIPEKMQVKAPPSDVIATIQANCSTVTQNS